MAIIESVPVEVFSGPGVGETVALSGGGRVMTWRSDNIVLQQVFDAAGNKLGGPTIVSPVLPPVFTDASPSPTIPEIYFAEQTAALADGGWVTTWNVRVTASLRDRIDQQVFNADGTPRGAASTVFQSLVSRGAEGPLHPEIIGLNDGGWVVSFLGQDAVRQQVFNADGSKHGGSDVVDTPAPNLVLSDFQDEAPITKLSDGGWVVSWAAADSPLPIDLGNGAVQFPIGQGEAFFQQVFNADGSKRGGQINASGFSEAILGFEVTALPGGGWVLTTEIVDSQSQGRDIRQQAFDANGNKLGGSTDVNSFKTGFQGDVDVTVLKDGGWVSTWESLEQDGSAAGIYQQAFNANGTPRGIETRVNINTVGDQSSPEIVAINGGGWVVVWLSSEVSGSQIRQQVFNADGSREGAETLVSDPSHRDVSLNDVTALRNGGWVVTSSFGVIDGIGNTITHVVEKLFQAPSTQPQGQDKTVTLTEGGFHRFAASDFGFSDTDGDQLASVIVTQLPQNGLLTLNGVVVSGGQEIRVGDLATLVWTPADNASGTGLANLAFKVVDDGDTAGGGQNTDETPNIVTFDVIPINDAPFGQDKTITVIEDTAYTFAASDFGFSDADGNNFSALIVTVLPTNGTLTLNGGNVSANQAIAAADLQKLVWTPSPDAAGNNLAFLSFKVVDDGGTFGGGENTDTVVNTIIFNVTDVPDIIRGTPGKDVLRGTQNDDTIEALGGNDTLDGKAGADRMIGGRGNDTYIVDNRRDQVIEKPGEGLDTVKSSVDFSLSGRPNIEKVILTGTASIDATGSNEANALFGNAGANLLKGAGGKDTLSGGAGKDRLDGGTGDDLMTGGGGVDRFVFSTGYDRDRIVDFKAAGSLHDVLDISGLRSVTSFTDLRDNHMVQSGRDVVIDGLNGDVLTLKNVRIADLDQGDFLI